MQRSHRKTRSIKKEGKDKKDRKAKKAKKEKNMHKQKALSHKEIPTNEQCLEAFEDQRGPFEDQEQDEMRDEM